MSTASKGIASVEPELKGAPTGPAPFDTARLISSPLLRRLYGPIKPLLEGPMGLTRLNREYAALRPEKEGIEAFCQAALDHLHVRMEVRNEEQLDALAEQAGPQVVVSNHPTGGVETFAFFLLLERIRPGGWKFFSNSLLASFPDFASQLIRMDSLGRRPRPGANAAGLREALAHLEAGGVLGLFPAGRVSRWSRRDRAVVDREWNSQALRLAQATGASLTAVHFQARPSRLFLMLPPSLPWLRTAFLPRELLRPQERRLPVSVGQPVSPKRCGQILTSGHAGAMLRALSYAMAEQHPVPHAGTAAPLPFASAPPEPSELVRQEARRLGERDNLLKDAGGLRLLVFRKEEAPSLFRQLTQERQHTFRLSGMGSDKPEDETPEDAYYHQLLLWDGYRERIAGAYRVGPTEEIIRERGRQGLYLEHIFQMKRGFHETLGPSFELSRSFVSPAYQGNPRALSLLWQGLAALMARYPGYRSLHGSVTISQAYSPLGRAVLVEYLKANHMDGSRLRRLVRARAPFVPATRYHRIVAQAFRGAPVDSLREVISATEGGNRPIPPLIRHYLPLGARFLAFHVEKDFGNAVYCLLRVDAEAIAASRLRRYGRG